MKKIFSLLAVITALAAAGFGVYAADNITITQYYSDIDEITVYTSETLADSVSARIAGVDCYAENIGNVYNDSEKYETIFLIDSSGSMKGFSDKISSFLLECIDKKQDNEYYSIGVFASGNTPEYLAVSENNQYALEKCVDSISYEFTSTYIYDNLINSFGDLNPDNDNVYRRIILITDGNENSARGITIDDVLEKITSDPLPVYTVTLQTSNKSNLENLKNIARIARRSGGEDIRIADGDNVTDAAAVISEAAKNVSQIRIIPDRSLLDGSVKAIEITDGTLTATADIRLAMAENTVAESIVQTTAETTAVTTEVTTTAITETPKRNVNVKVIIVSAAAVIVAGCIVSIIIFAGQSKKKQPEQEENTPLSNNDETMIISGRSGDTEILIDDDSVCRYRTVILRDTANSAKTFEFQLSSEGVIIGRSSDMSNIVVDYDRSISRKHCRIFLKNGSVYLEDINSGNKTYLNDTAVTVPAVLNNSDEIKIGRTRLRVTLK